MVLIAFLIRGFWRPPSILGMRAFSIVGEPFRSSLHTSRFFDAIKNCKGRAECFQALFREAKVPNGLMYLGSLHCASLGSDNIGVAIDELHHLHCHENNQA